MDASDKVKFKTGALLSEIIRIVMKLSAPWDIDYNRSNITIGPFTWNDCPKVVVGEIKMTRCS